MERGLTYSSTLVVGREQLAVTVGSGDLEVLATPALVALAENAAMLAVKDHLPDGATTVGGYIQLTHSKPSALGATVVATATLTEVEGRKLTFAVRATDGADTVGDGVHVRFVVDRERFISKLK